MRSRPYVCLLWLLAGISAMPATGRAQRSETESGSITAASYFGHAHNDESHSRPLLDALDNGFTSVEADVVLLDGDLFVAHEAKSVQKDRTLEKLYLEPLAARVRRAGRVQPNSAGFTLLIDVKTDPPDTWRRLATVLAPYADVLTEFRDDGVTTRPITIILSDTRTRILWSIREPMLAGFDGRLQDLATTASKVRIPWISDNWQQHFKWRGENPMPEADRIKLLSLVRQAHAEGRKIRFWAAPDNPLAWRILVECGIDIINTDHLSQFHEFAGCPTTGTLQHK